jgi:hypothetical protein
METKQHLNFEVITFATDETSATFFGSWKRGTIVHVHSRHPTLCHVAGVCNKCGLSICLDNTVRECGNLVSYSPMY